MKEIITTRASFETFVDPGCNAIYVDKTSYVHRLVSNLDGFFISRPRRFGKSFMCSTLDALFSGKKELFTDLYIGKTDYDFKSYPVLRFDFSALNTDSAESFRQDFRDQIRENAAKNGVLLDDAMPSSMMRRMLSSLGFPVIIIDESDSPMIYAVSRGKTELAEAMRDDFNAFYKVIKSCTGKKRFLFMTGCTKLSGLSIFSAMNNLNDISTDPRYAGMFGYTEDELKEYFSEHIEQKLNMPGSPYRSREEFLEALRGYYDGYHFSDCDVERVYNPVSTGKYFSSEDIAFSNYWMTTGGLSTLAVTLASHNNLLSIVEEKLVLDAQDLAVFDITTLSASSFSRRSALALLYYAGYLTIADADGPDLYLDFPNTEVRSTFLSALIELYGDFSRSAGAIARAAAKAAARGDVEGLVNTLNGYYRSFHSTELKVLKEAGIQTLFKALFVIAGVKVMTEVPSGLGRLDALLVTEEHNYIIEFKVDGKSSDDAIEIIKRHYGWLPGQETKPLHLLGLDFRTDKQQIVSYTHRLCSSGDEVGISPKADV